VWLTNRLTAARIDHKYPALGPLSPTNHFRQPEADDNTTIDNNSDRDSTTLTPAMATFTQPLNFMGTTKIKGKRPNLADLPSRPDHTSFPSSLAIISRITNTEPPQTRSTARTSLQPRAVASPLTPTTQYVSISRAASLAAHCCHTRQPADTFFLQETSIPGGSHRRTRFTDQSNIRVAGGKAAGPKPIKANYDADDARIVDLKQQGWSDEYVARKLAEEGRIRYVGRTVGSRWLRIRKALEAKEEEILEDEMSDWHDGEV
jgi:hypothetical protein